jgi:hypothetical protein
VTEKSGRLLGCTQCGSPAAVAEDTEGCVDWGLAVVDEDGVVRPQSTDPEGVTAVTNILRVRACCTNPGCEYQWTLRRRFDPTRI